MTPEAQVPRKRATLRSVVGVLWPGNRDGDKRLRRYGLTAVVVTTLLSMVGDTLKAQRQALEAIPVVMADAMKTQNEANREALERVADRLEGLTTEAAALRGEAATVRGMVLGRLKCPPCGPCPACPAAPKCPELSDRRLPRER